MNELDELCMRMLGIGALGGAEKGTDNMKASEVKALLVPFFGKDRVDRCVDLLRGRPDIEEYADKTSETLHS